jgi:hypothetical protein
MPDRKSMPADGDGRYKGAPDGVSGAPEDGAGVGISSRTDGGESGGGNYPNPHGGKNDPLPHVVEAGGRSFAVVEESGVAAAEAAGSDIGRRVP